MRSGWGRDEHGDLRGELLNHRRVAILVVILLGFLVETLLFSWIEKKTIGKWNPKKG